MRDTQVPLAEKMSAICTMETVMAQHLWLVSDFPSTTGLGSGGMEGRGEAGQGLGRGETIGLGEGRRTGLATGVGVTVESSWSIISEPYMMAFTKS